MTSSSIVRLGLTLAVAGAALAACSGTSSSPSIAASVAAPTTAPSESPSASAESPSASTAVTPSESPGVRTVQLQATDTGYMNPPVNPTVGMVLTFRNVGTEAHEMVVIRRNDDATKKQTFDDLTKVSPADLLKYVTVVGVLAADPGKEADGQVVLDQPGDYAVVDLLPTGTATAPASPDPMAIPTGIPNLTKGLVTTFTVAAPAPS